MPKPSGDGFRGSVPNVGVRGRFPCRRKQEAAIAAVSEMVADGVSAGRVRHAAQPMGMGRMGAGQVSRMRPSPDDAVADLQGACPLRRQVPPRPARCHLRQARGFRPRVVDGTRHRRRQGRRGHRGQRARARLRGHRRRARGRDRRTRRGRQPRCRQEGGLTCAKTTAFQVILGSSGSLRLPSRTEPYTNNRDTIGIPSSDRRSPQDEI